jgi:hypothetical protein
MGRYLDIVRTAEIKLANRQPANPFERAKALAAEAAAQGCDLLDYLCEQAPDLIALSPARRSLTIDGQIVGDQTQSKASNRLNSDQPLVGYLESFPEKKRATNTSQILTDKTDKILDGEIVEGGTPPKAAKVLNRDQPFGNSVTAVPSSPEDAADRVAALDAERNKHDRVIGRGYDYARLDQSPPSPQIAMDPSVQAELSRIWPEAERLGWSHARIWNAQFWPNSDAQPRGLAAVLQPGDTIVEVTEQWITLLAQRHHTQRFPKSES